MISVAQTDVALPADLCQRLAARVLDDAPRSVRLALEVLRGDDHTLNARRTIELAELVLQRHADGRDTDDATASKGR